MPINIDDMPKAHKLLQGWRSQITMIRQVQSALAHNPSNIVVKAYTNEGKLNLFDENIVNGELANQILCQVLEYYGERAEVLHAELEELGVDMKARAPGDAASPQTEMPNDVKGLLDDWGDD